MQLQNNISLKPYNTFGIDVNAKFFTEVSSEENLKEVLSHFKNESKLILGGGSNILFTKNFEGVAIKNNFKGIELINEDPNFFYVKAAAGEVWHEFVLHCINNNYAGIENLSLIPGCVGASPMQNIGAYGVEIKDTFHSLEAIHIQELTKKTFTKEACKFGYRESIFKHEVKNEFVITSVTFRLNKQPTFNTSYGAIEQELEKMKITIPSIKAISEAVCAIRRSKLPDPKKIGNAGSFFKNPEVSSQLVEIIKQKHPSVPAYPLENGHYKLAAGWLIEQAGWKGKIINNYGVHKDQALVLVNYGGASGIDIYNLSQQILDSVSDKFGVLLEREVNIL